MAALIAVVALASWLVEVRYNLELFEKVYLQVRPGIAQEEVVQLLGEPRVRLKGDAALADFLQNGGFSEVASDLINVEAFVYVRMWYAHVVWFDSDGLVVQVRSTKT